MPRHPPCALISLTFHIHSVECAVSCLCPSCDGFSYFYFVFYLETDLTPSSSDVFFFCLQKILPLFSGALFLRQVLRFLFLLYSVFKVPLWLFILSAIKIRNSLRTFIAVKLSGDGEIRTLDPLLARQVLSQLSYTPVLVFNLFLFNFFH